MADTSMMVTCVSMWKLFKSGREEIDCRLKLLPNVTALICCVAALVPAENLKVSDYSVATSQMDYTYT
jgi:hypothetical protein